MQGHTNSLFPFLHLDNKDKPKREIKITQPTAPKDSYYAILGIPVDAPYLMIQNSYMSKLVELKKTDGDLKLQSVLNTAYQTLCDDTARKKYDEKIQLVRPTPWSILTHGETASIHYNKHGFFTSIAVDVQSMESALELKALRKGETYTREGYITYIQKLNLESKNPLIKAIAKKAPLNEIKEILSKLSSDLKNERDLSQDGNTPPHLAILIDRDDDMKEEGALLTLLRNAGCDFSIPTHTGYTLSHQVIRVLKNPLLDLLDELGVTADDWEFLNLKKLGVYGSKVSNRPAAVVEVSNEPAAKASPAPK